MNVNNKPVLLQLSTHQINLDRYTELEQCHRIIPQQYLVKQIQTFDAKNKEEKQRLE